MAKGRMRSGWQSYVVVAAVGVISATTTLAIQSTALADDTLTASVVPPSAGYTTKYVARATQAEARLDFDEAITWYKQAAYLGDAKSMYELGCLYFGFHDIPGRELKDYAKAAAWFQKSAELNYIPALTKLGVMYNGDGSLGVPEDRVKAAQLFLKAAQAGDAQAMDNLAVMYGQGKGVPKDIDAAVRWWKKAVEVDGNGQSGKAAQSWLDVHDGKPVCVYCASSTK